MFQKVLDRSLITHSSLSLVVISKISLQRRIARTLCLSSAARYCANLQSLYRASARLWKLCRELGRQGKQAKLKASLSAFGSGRGRQPSEQASHLTFLSLSLPCYTRGIIIGDPWPPQAVGRPKTEDKHALLTERPQLMREGIFRMLLFVAAFSRLKQEILTSDLQVSLQWVGMAESGERHQFIKESGRLILCGHVLGVGVQGERSSCPCSPQQLPLQHLGAFCPSSRGQVFEFAL